jgi:CRP-like cAMP-binding protein
VTGTLEAVKYGLEGAGALAAPVLLALLGIRGAILVVGLVVPVAVVLQRRPLRGLDRRAAQRVDQLELVRTVPWARPLTMEALEGVVARLRDERVAPGTVVVREGDEGDAWYLVADGELEVQIVGRGVDVLRRGDAFGELALLRATHRSATVVARTDAALLSLSRDDFLEAVAGPDAAVSAAPAGGLSPSVALAAVPLLRHCRPAAIAEMVARSAERPVAEGAAIITAGATDDALFVLLDGRASVQRDGAVVRELLPGDAFGEVAVLHGVPRTADVVAGDGARVLSVPGDAVRAALAVTAPSS